MSSEYPSLHLNLQQNGTSFKRTFEQFGYDSGSPMTSALQASGSGPGNHLVSTGSSSNNGGNERNKRARSTSSSSVSDRSADSSRSSEYNTARSSASLSETSTNDQNLSLDQNMRSTDYTLPVIASPSSTCTLATPAPALPGTPQDEDMSDTSGFSLDIPRPAPLPTLEPSTTTHDALRNSLERFNEFDSHIAALRRSHSRTPSWIRTASPAQSPLPSTNATADIENWDWTHFGDSSSSSHTSGEDSQHQFPTNATNSVGSGGTFTAVPRQGDSLSFPASDGLSRPGYATSSNSSSSTSSLTIPPRPSYRPSPPISSSRANPFPRESNEFLNGTTGSSDSVASVLQTERNNTDTLDGRQGAGHSSPGSSDLPWAAFGIPHHPSPATASLDVATRPDVVFVPSTSDLLTTQSTRRGTDSGIASRTMSSARTTTNTSTASVFPGSFSRFYDVNQERLRTSDPFEVDSDPLPSPSASRYENRAARAETLAGPSRNSGRPFSEALASFERERAAQDSGEAESSPDPFFAEHSTDHGFNERRRRMIARNHHNIASEDNDDDDDDDDSHPESVREIIEGLHNARGLLERGVETARFLSGSPSRPEPSPPQPQPRYRFHSRMYSSATTMSSNSLVSESAAEHRRTNARAQLRSELFNSRPDSDDQLAEFSSSTAATRLRRLIANQADSLPSSNISSRPPSSGRASDSFSRPFGFNSSGTSSQLPRGGLDDRERVRFAEILSDHRHPHTRSGDDISPSRDHNAEVSLDNMFNPVFAQINALPDFPSSTEEDAQPPYVYRPPTPPLHSLRAHSRSPPRLSWERPQASTNDSSARSHPFSNVNLEVFPPGIYRDSLRRSIQASQGRSIPRVLEPTPYEPPTFSPGNSDEDNDSDDIDYYFGVSARRGRREHTAVTSARFAPRRMMPEPAVSTTSLAFGVDSHDTSLQSNSASTGSHRRIPPPRGQPSDEHLRRHRPNEQDRGLPSSPLDPFWSGNRHDTSTHNSRLPSWEVSEARDRMRAIRDLMDRYGTDSERSDLASRRDIPPPHQTPTTRPGNPNRHALLPWRSSLHSSSTNSGPTSVSRSFSSSSNDLGPYRNIGDRPRERQEPAPPEERTPIRTLRQRAGLIRGAPRTDGTRIRSMFRTMARRNLGDYMPDELFDSSYEGLLSLGETLGEARSKATPADVIASLPTGTYQTWAKEDSETRCPICLDDYGRDDIVTKLVECPHWLHKTCMEQWLRTANTCPVCRKKVKGSPKCPFKPNPATSVSSGAASGSGSRASESGTSGSHGRSESTSGVVGIRLSDIINRARRGSNTQSGSGTQQHSPPRVQTGDVSPTEGRYNSGGATHYHHHHYHYLHIHPPRPDQSHGSQYPDPYRPLPSPTSNAAQTGAGSRPFPSTQNTGGPRPIASGRLTLSRPTSWFGSMTNRASARRVPESPQDSSPRFPSSAMDYEGSFGRRSSFTSEASSFHHPVPAPQSTFGVPPPPTVTSNGSFAQMPGSSSSSSSSSSSTTSASNRLDTYSLATGELQQPFHGTSRTNAGSLGSRSHMNMHPNNAGSAVQHLGSFNRDDGLDSRNTTTSSNYVRPSAPSTAGVPPWWR